MSKGDKRRPSFVPAEEYSRNYDRIFKGVKPEVPTATQVECTAIVKYVPLANKTEQGNKNDS